MKSKICMVVLVLGVLSVTNGVKLPAELQEYVDDLHKLCIDKSGITEADHQNYEIHNKDQKMMMKPDGTIDYEFIETSAHPDVKDVLMAAINKCRIIDNGADLCEKSYNFNWCLHEADPVNWFFV